MNRDGDQEVHIDNNSSGLKIEGAKCAEIIIQFVVSGIFALLFYIFSTNPDRYGGDDCQLLRFWAYWFAIFSFVALFFNIVTTIMILINLNFLTCKVTTDQILYFVVFIFFIGMAVVFFFGEPCGDLRTLVAVVLIIFLVGLILACCCVCCFALFFGSAMAGAASQAQAQQSQQQQ